MRISGVVTRRMLKLLSVTHASTRRALRDDGADALVLQKPALSVDPGRESGEHTLGPDDSMARHDDAYGIPGDGVPDGARRAGPAYSCRKLAVGHGLPIGDVEERLPHRRLPDAAS